MFIVRKQFNRLLDEQTFCSESQAIAVAAQAYKTGRYQYVQVISTERNETVVELGTNPNDITWKLYAKTI